MKKLLCLLCALMLTFSLVPVSAENATRTFTDSLGREVTLPAVIERIAVTGSIGKITLFAIAPDLMVGLPEPWDDIEKQYIDEQYHDMVTLGQLYGGKGELNLEELLMANPQVVIDIGDPKAGVAEDMDAMMQQTGLPWVHITAQIDSLDETYTLLGKLLGREEQGKKLADYCENTYNKLVALVENVEKENVLYILGEKGLNVLAANSYHSVLLDMLTNNLAVVDNPLSKGTGNEVDMEQILLWNPDTIIFAPESIYATVHEDAIWQSISAIQTGQYYEAPVGPFNWMGMPPSVQRLLGMMWMCKLFYPEAATYDLYEEVSEYYQLFYHKELTQEQYDSLMKNSLGK